MSDLTAVASTAVGVGSAVALCALYVIRSENARQNKPLSDAMLTLDASVKGLTSAMVQQKTDERERHADTQEAITAIRDVLGDHEARLRVIEQPGPPAASMRARKRGAA